MSAEASAGNRPNMQATKFAQVKDIIDRVNGAHSCKGVVGLLPSSQLGRSSCERKVCRGKAAPCFIAIRMMLGHALSGPLQCRTAMRRVAHVLPVLCHAQHVREDAL